MARLGPQGPPAQYRPISLPSNWRRRCFSGIFGQLAAATPAAQGSESKAAFGLVIDGAVWGIRVVQVSLCSQEAIVNQKPGC